MGPRWCQLCQQSYSYNMAIIMLPKECGIWLLAARKPINKPSWRKGKFALFQMLATGDGEGGKHLFKGQSHNPPPPHDKQGVRLFIDRVGRGEVTCRNSTVISNSHVQLVISGLTSIVLVVLGIVKSSILGCTCFHFFEVSSQNCGSSSPGYSLVSM